MEGLGAQRRRGMCICTITGAYASKNKKTISLLIRASLEETKWHRKKISTKSGISDDVAVFITKSQRLGKVASKCAKCCCDWRVKKNLGTFLNLENIFIPHNYIAQKKFRNLQDSPNKCGSEFIVRRRQFPCSVHLPCVLFPAGASDISLWHDIRKSVSMRQMRIGFVFSDMFALALMSVDSLVHMTTTIHRDSILSFYS